MIFWTWLIFTGIFGACVGSFLNVIIYRLPEGKSLVTPGSHCLHCGQALSWYENVPVLAWFALRGRCRHCKAPISFQYPFIEAISALLFAALFYVYYMTDLRQGFSGYQMAETWPAFVVHLVLLGGLIAATVIDARLYIIPLSIPWLVTAVAWVVMPVAAAFLPQIAGVYYKFVNQFGLGAAIGGVIGLMVALILLVLKVLPRSFDDETEDDPDAQTQGAQAEGSSPRPNPQDWLSYPHPRREVLKESLFVALPIIGLIVGILVTFNSGTGSGPIEPVWLHVLIQAVCGYIVGGGLVWATRILGTLGFGKEAMGLGDVHLLAAIGAVIGPIDVVLVFFLAPFMGLAVTIAITGISAILKERGRAISYGPYLAAAAVVVMMFRQPLLKLIWHDSPLRP